MSFADIGTQVGTKAANAFERDLIPTSGPIKDAITRQIKNPNDARRIAKET